MKKLLSLRQGLLNATILFTIICNQACTKTVEVDRVNLGGGPTRTVELDTKALDLGFVILKDYAVNGNVLLPDTINHKFIVTAEEFYKTFYMTKAGPGTAIVPDFTSQFVVAIILPLTEKVMSIDIHKAEKDDKSLNIYYTITDTTSWTTYPHIIKAVAAVSKSDSITQINFYNNNIKERTFFLEP